MSSIKLNLGCGLRPLDGWVNVDIMPLEAVDGVMDFESTLPFQGSSIIEFRADHVLEHIDDPLAFMGELYRVAQPEAKALFKVPYGSSDMAWEDPTHKRAYYLNSWGYFSQPFYWRADYGYRGDWFVSKIDLLLAEEFAHLSLEEARGLVMTSRNIVLDMAATLVAIKPARLPLRELQNTPDVHISYGRLQ